MANFKEGLILGSLAGKIEGVFPTGEIEITENGEYNVTDKATAVVNVAGGGYSGVSVIPLQDMTQTFSIITTVS